MGVKNLSALFTNTEIELKRPIGLSDLNGKIVGLDGFNQLFQFLASIRDDSGRSMSDKDGRVTSHLIGILTRNCALLQEGIIPVYVFDGKSHPLKQREKDRRRELTRLAEVEYKKALQEGDLIKAKKFAQRTNKLTPDMVDDAKMLLDAMGIPWVQAPGEGEAQAAQMTKEGTVYATASQDYDAMMFGSPKMIRNLNISGRRTHPGGRVIEIKPEILQLNQILQVLSITQEQLIDIGILLGSDFNPDGFKKVGPKTAYKYIKKHGDFETVVTNETLVSEIDTPFEEIRKIFLEPNVTKGIELKLDNIFDQEKIKRFLVDERGFSEGRYVGIIEKTARAIENRENQSTLDDWF
ncbi:MAG: flap endonuclease-1 [Candidatus Kariarchaeaceae archaeon]